MPTGPKGQKRPADVTGNAVHVMRVLTGEADEAAGEGQRHKKPVDESPAKRRGSGKAAKSQPPLSEP